MASTGWYAAASCGRCAYLAKHSRSRSPARKRFEVAGVGPNDTKRLCLVDRFRLALVRAALRGGVRAEGPASTTASPISTTDQRSDRGGRRGRDAEHRGQRGIPTPEA